MGWANRSWFRSPSQADVDRPKGLAHLPGLDTPVFGVPETELAALVRPPALERVIFEDHAAVARPRGDSHGRPSADFDWLERGHLAWVVAPVLLAIASEAAA